MTTIELWVPGVPVPQGNLSASRTGRLYHTNNDSLEPWRHSIGWRARQAMREAKSDVLQDVPIALSMWFVLYRPKSTAKTRATPWAIKKPDLDKLARAVGDSLTGPVYLDDSQIVEIHCYKRISDGDDDPCGVEVIVTTDVSTDDGEELEDEMACETA